MRGCDGEHLDEVDVGESTFAQLPDDSVAILIDPDVLAAVGGVVERVQSRERAAHLPPLVVCSLSLEFLLV